MRINKSVNIRANQGIILCLGLILSIAVLSCKNEMRNDQDIIPDNSAEYKVLELPFRVLNHDSSTPSLASLRVGGTQEDGDFDQDSYGGDPLNENKIKKIDLFIIESGNVRGHYSSTNMSLDLKRNSVKAKINRSVADQLEGKNVQIIMVANAAQNDFSSVATYDDLKASVQDDKGKLTPNAQEGKILPREKFLMDGSITVVLSWGDKNMIKPNASIELRRAASKIRVRLNHTIDVVDLQNGVETKYAMVGSPSIKLVHYTEKGTLIKCDTPYEVKPDEWQDESSYREMVLRSFNDKNESNNPKYNGSFYAAFPFYTYENDWSNGAKQLNETYAMIKIKMRPVDDSGKPYFIDSEGNVVDKNTRGSMIDPGRDYYYRLPINFRKAIDGTSNEKLHKLERNHLYDIYTTIGVLGSIDEGKPMDVTSHVAVQEWNKPDKIDGSIEKANFLVVMEHTPLMPNTKERRVGYISNTPVNILISRAYYQYYDIRGNYYRVEFDNKGDQKTYDKDGSVVETVSKKGEAWDGVKVTASSEHLENGVLTIIHSIPVNYVPFYIEFTVKQQSPGNLEEKVMVTQYPPRFVTGHKSSGLINGSEMMNGMPVYADFRHHTPLGSLAPFLAIGSTKPEAQANEIFSRISTVVPQSGEIIGIAVDREGKTKSDDQSNKMISPEFIISSQYGMSQGTEQRHNTSRLPDGGFYTFSSFAKRYGPNSGRFKDDALYYNVTRTSSGDYYDYYSRTYNHYYRYYVNSPVPKNYSGRDPINQQLLWRAYTTAEDRCYNYFEGEYGTDGDYVEHYIDTNGAWQSRKIHKTFKYQGRWRIPTLSEVKMVHKLQIDPNSTVKGLMFGSYYWVAKDGKAFDFRNNDEISSSYVPSNYWGGYQLPQVYVRCVFDTFGLDDKGETEVRK